MIKSYVTSISKRRYLFFSLLLSLTSSPSISKILSLKKFSVQVDTSNNKSIVARKGEVYLLVGKPLETIQLRLLPDVKFTKVKKNKEFIFKIPPIVTRPAVFKFETMNSDEEFCVICYPRGRIG